MGRRILGKSSRSIYYYLDCAVIRMRESMSMETELAQIIHTCHWHKLPLEVV